MSRQTKYGIRDLKREFPSNDACLEYLFLLSHSKKCSCGGTYRRIYTRKQFQCSKCRYQIAPMSGTIFEKSTTPLTLWFHAILVFSNAKSGISASEMERQLNVTYKTAFRMLKRIREHLKQDTRLLKGSVEIDEGFFGGRGKVTKTKDQSQIILGKSRVIAAYERGGDMRTELVDVVSASTVQRFVEKNIEAKSRLVTDKNPSYIRVAKKGYKHESVNHSKKEYSRGDVHVNHVESFWAHVKLSIRGTHKGVSKQYLSSYLDGFVFHYNTRNNDRKRFDALLSKVLERKAS